MTNWTLLHPRADLGMLEYMLWDSDPRPAREQFAERYSYGGGWSPLSGWSRNETEITYPGDPPLKPIAKRELRDETIYLYPHAWVMILQADGTFEVARMD